MVNIKQNNYQMAEFNRAKAPNFVNVLYIFTLKLLDLHSIF